MWIAILRIVIPIVIIILLLGMILPRIKKYRDQRDGKRIDVEAEVVNSKQHETKAKNSDIPKSATYKPSDVDEAKE